MHFLIKIIYIIVTAVFFSVQGCGNSDSFGSKTGSVQDNSLGQLLHTKEASVPPIAKAVDCTQTGHGKVYEVSSDKDSKYKNIIDVPWEALGPGDMVRIQYRNEPYRERILISSSGTAAEPIRICGVRSADGKLPVIDGQNAVSRRGAPFAWSGSSTEHGIDESKEEKIGTQDRGLVVLTLSKNGRYGEKPSHIVIEGLEIRGAYGAENETDRVRNPGIFSDHYGNTRRYTPNAASIFVERGENITIRGNILTNSGLGFFIAAGGDEERLCQNIMVDGNVIYGNGNIGSDRHHNVYSECIYTTYQHNFFGRQRKGAIGNNLKDRGAGTVVRYNWFEGGAHMNDLVERQDGGLLIENHPSYRKTHVYGNVYISDQSKNDGNHLIHYGGDNGDPTIYHKGTLYFYHNTILIMADEDKRWRTMLFDLPPKDRKEPIVETIEAKNNIIYMVGTSKVSLLGEESMGTLNLGVNYINYFEKTYNGKGQAKITGLENLISTDNPGLSEDLGSLLHLEKNSICRQKSVSLENWVSKDLQVDQQWNGVGQTIPRNTTTSLGAFE